MPRVRWPSYSHTKYPAKERNFLWKKLVGHVAFQNRTFVGSERRGQCILVNSVRIRNPYAKKGEKPEYLSAQQIAFIHEHHYLPNNYEIVDTRKRIELSHVCHQKLCINVRKRHIVAEEHTKNMLRILHHLVILIQRLVNLLNREFQKTDESQRTLRSHTKSKPTVIEVGVELPKNVCKCSPPCFKNFD